MNRERLGALETTLIWLRDTPDAQFLAAGGGAHFDFQWFRLSGNCGTKMCLAGWYVYLHPDCGLKFDSCDSIISVNAEEDDAEPDDFNELALHFDIPEWLSMALFLPPSEDDDPANENDLDFNAYDFQKRQFWAGRAIEQLHIVAKCQDEDLTDAVKSSHLEATLAAVWRDQIPYERNSHNAS